MTPVAHAAVGLAGWKLFSRERDRRALGIFIFVACAVDLDFVLYYAFGRPPVFVHQLYSHNVIVTALIAFAFFPLLKTARERWGLLLTGLSHLVMDVFVIDTLPPIGFRPFFPISNKFYNFGFFPYVGKESWRSVFSVHNALVVGLEALVFAVPALIYCRKELGLLRKKSAAASTAD